MQVSTTKKLDLVEVGRPHSLINYPSFDPILAWTSVELGGPCILTNYHELSSLYG